MLTVHERSSQNPNWYFRLRYFSNSVVKDQEQDYSTMKLLCQKEHPNGLKVLVASALSGNVVNIVEEKGVPSGAVLEVREGNTTFHLHANSAVLFLLNASRQECVVSEDCEKWLEWEATELQPVLVPYLISVAGGKEDKSLRAALDSLLTSLCASNHLSAQGLSATSVVFFSSLLPLISEAESQTFLQEHHPSLLAFIKTLKEQSHYKECVSSWYKSESFLKTWIAKGPIPYNPVQSTLALLKSSPSTTPLTSSSASTPPEQNKSARAAVSREQLIEAQSAWIHPSANTLRTPNPAPVLPVEGETNILITSALPYVNNVPHLGNIIGCVLSADCFARFCRLRGDNVLYICGTDEYGTATENKAIAEGLTPQQICDKYHVIHADVYKWFNISFDYFGRTTTEQQTKIAQDIFTKLDNNGKIFKESVEQLYCKKCERFLADRFVEGICPHPGCGYEDARGDQCDGCGKLINAMELVKPRCKLCSSLPEVKSSNHLFLDLPSIEPDLSSWLATTSKQWTNNAKVICDSWIRDGLKTRCITRDLKWGTPVPKDGFRDKVFYVWFDAPIGYLSITACYTDQWEKWWKNPSHVQYYEFMAKDNVPFHGVVFPSTQLGSGDNWTIVNNLIATEYLNYEDGKFSKSRGVGVFGDQVMDTGIPSDVWRFYLLYLRPEVHDTAFSWVDLQTKNNSELLNNLGNFVHRSLSFVFKFFGSAIPAAKPTEPDFRVMVAVNQELQLYATALGNNRQRDGLRHILSITRIGNQYIQEHEPYKLIKPDRSAEDRERGATVTAIAANIVALVSVILSPYMPNTAEHIQVFLNKPPQLQGLPSLFTQFLSTGHVIQEPKPLITPIDDEMIQKLAKKFAGQAVPEKKPVNPAEVCRLESLVQEQANKVRKLKEGGSAGKDVITAEVATLISLKGQLAVAQGSDPAASVGKDKKKKGNDVKAETSPVGASPNMNGPVDEKEVNRLQVLVTEQGNKVRKLKEGGSAGKDVIAAEVATLISLKSQLAVAQGSDPAAPAGKDKKKKKGNDAKAETSPVGASPNMNGPVDEKEVNRLQVLVTEQGTRVRAIKAKAGVSKNEIGVEVTKLLDLKNQLSIAQGIDPAVVNSKDKKKKK
ncbi:methionine--tRNA ligase, cytoplasmic [Procambarus clarkii]|uniref:methionine--tRNA ligase, cytoplasmic n=1 Tax=Procambarus clarkii TaxID=6728 RepID=UPI003743A57F